MSTGDFIVLWYKRDEQIIGHLLTKCFWLLLWGVAAIPCHVHYWFGTYLCISFMHHSLYWCRESNHPIYSCFPQILSNTNTDLTHLHLQVSTVYGVTLISALLISAQASSISGHLAFYIFPPYINYSLGIVHVLNQLPELILDMMYSKFQLWCVFLQAKQPPYILELCQDLHPMLNRWQY